MFQLLHPRLVLILGSDGAPHQRAGKLNVNFDSVTFKDIGKAGLGIVRIVIRNS